jgi:hypothetical protein
MKKSLIAELYLFCHEFSIGETGLEMSTMQIEKFYWTIVVEFIGLKLVES